MPLKQNADLDEIEKMFVELNSKIDGVISEAKEIHAKLDAVTTEQKKLLEKIEEENEQLRAEMCKLSARCDRLEDEHRRRNWIISGIPLDADQTEIENFRNSAGNIGLTKNVIDAMKIEQVIRMKKKASGKPGDVIVKFGNVSDKMCVLKAARISKPKDLYVKEDFSLNVRIVRKNLLKPMLNARKMKLKAFMIADKLIVDKDGKKNTYTYSAQEAGLKVVSKNFNLDPFQLLSVEHGDDEDVAEDEEELNTSEH